MQRELGKDIKDPKSREQFLRDNADKLEEKGYMKRFSPDRILSMKEELSNVSIDINDIEVEKKKVMAEFKERLTPLVDRKKELLGHIKNKAEYTIEITFKFVDQDERMVGFYNSEGDLIESRPAMADELQGTIFQLNRTGTHD